MTKVKLTREPALGSLPATWGLWRIGSGSGRGEGTGFKSVAEAFARQYGLEIAERENARPDKRRVAFNDLPINIEIEAGDVKSGYDDTGLPWSHTYEIPYGEIAGTEGDDGDAVDVYLGPYEWPHAPVFVVHQLHRDGTPDEDKVFLGLLSAAEGEDCYRRHGPAWGFGGLEQMTLDEFKNGYLAATRAPAGPKLFETSADRAEAGRTRYGTP